jgi:O-antigen ligase
MFLIIFLRLPFSVCFLLPFCAPFLPFLFISVCLFVWVLLYFLGSSIFFPRLDFFLLCLYVSVCLFPSWFLSQFISFLLMMLICLFFYFCPYIFISASGVWLQIQRSRIRFPALPNFLRSSGSGTGSTQPRQDNWGATWKESSGSGLENRN